MKAAVFKEPGVPMSIETIDDPTPMDSQLVVEVAYCGICGTDLHATRAGPAALPCNSVLGHEFVGEVVGFGRALQHDWQLGDRVCALPFHSCGKCASCLSGRPFECVTLSCIGLDAPGGFAEYVTTSETNTLRLPDQLSMADAALIEPLAVALHAVRQGGLTAGQRVLVTGGGPIGLCVALWAQFMGARAVVVSEPAEDRRMLALKMGATDVLQPSKRLGKHFSDLVGGPPDILFECVGAPGLLQECINIAPRRATIVAVGMNENPDTLHFAPALVKELALKFVIAYTREDFDITMSLMAQGRINASAMVTTTVSLEEMPAIFEALRTPSEQCKVLTRLK